MTPKDPDHHQKSPSTVRVVTWNVNGLRPLCALPPNQVDPTLPPTDPVQAGTCTTIPLLMQALACSILCVQETKLPRTHLSSCAIDWSFLASSPPSHDAFFSFCRKAPSQQAQRIGYSGVATFTDIRLPVIAAQDGLLLTTTSDPHVDRPIVSIPHLPLDVPFPQSALDAEGRCAVTDLGAFVLLNIYCPNDPGDDPARAQYKHAFHALVSSTVANLRSQVPPRELMLVGDLNVAHRPLDHCDPYVGLAPTVPGQSRDKAFQAARPARQWLSDLLTTHGLVDVYRAHHPTTSGFTCWNTVINARRSDYGTRLDYILVSPRLAHLVVGVDRMPHVLGSDHCPVYVDLKCEGLLAELFGQHVGQPPPLGSARRLPEFRGKQATLAQWATPTPPPPASTPIALTTTIKTTSTKKRAGQQLKLSSFFTKPASNSSTPRSTSTDNAGAPAVDRMASSTSATQSASKSAWAAIFTPTAPPTCHHNEPCTSFVVNKSGPTQGRKFWVCARPVGPSANGTAKDKAVGEWRCGFFLWDKQRSRQGGSPLGGASNGC